MKLVRKQVPGTRLGIVGGGPNLQKLQDSFDPSFATFTGYLYGEELAAAFASGDVFVFSSVTETLGLVALVFFSSAVPVVITNAGGIPLVVHDAITGFLIDADYMNADCAEYLFSIIYYTLT